jgi:hypothetical protein
MPRARPGIRETPFHRRKLGRRPGVDGPSLGDRSLITTRSAAALLHCSPRDVRKLKDLGRLTPRQYERFGKFLFDLDEVVELARSGYQGRKAAA